MESSFQERLLSGLQAVTSINQEILREVQAHRQQFSDYAAAPSHPSLDGTSANSRGRGLSLSSNSAAQSQLQELVAERARLRDENTNLHEECSELRSKVSSLQKIITRAGRRQEPLLDPGIVTDFTRLNSGIFQFVRNHLAATLPGPGIAPGITDLYIQSQVATALHSKFFSRDAILFGYSDHKPYSVFSGFEKDLKSHECDEEEVRNWRVSTVQMASFLFDKIGYRENHRKHFCRNQATEIWYGTLQEYHRIGKAKKTDAAMEELFELCNLAYSITLTFRGSKTEYEWEQDPGQLAISMMNDGKQIEVVGITGQSPNDAANSKVAFVVFGGVVRGDKTTGLLRDGKNCLMPTSVVKGSLCGLAIPNIK